MMSSGSAGSAGSGMPKVLLLGDSITTSPGYASTGSSGYAPIVAEQVRAEGIEVVWFAPTKGWNTRRVLEAIEEGAFSCDADVIQFNAGLHDIATRDLATGCAVPLNEYAENLKAIVAAFRARTPATLIWAPVTPVIDAKHQSVKGFIRREVDVLAYNAAAAVVMAASGIPVHDLYAVLAASDMDVTLGPDGCHPSVAGRTLLAGAVCDALRAHLSMRAHLSIA